MTERISYGHCGRKHLLAKDFKHVKEVKKSDSEHVSYMNAKEKLYNFHDLAPVRNLGQSGSKIVTMHLGYKHGKLSDYVTSGRLY